MKLVDCVDTVEEEHVEGMKEERGHDHDEDEEHTHTCGCGCEDDDEDVIIAKIVTNDDGEDEYVEPTDEEFEAVQQAYNALVDEAEKD